MPGRWRTGTYPNASTRCVGEWNTTPMDLARVQYIRVLRLLEHSTLGQLADAVDYALDIGITDADSIRVILEHRRESPVALFSLDGRPHLKAVHVDVTDVRSYQSLLLGAGGDS